MCRRRRHISTLAHSSPAPNKKNQALPWLIAGQIQKLLDMFYSNNLKLSHAGAVPLKTLIRTVFKKDVAFLTYL
jgi:hypothetical protein